jgi:hypothetical protein
MTILKSPDTKKEVLPEKTKTKGKRKHKPTACMDMRRAYNSCGICGSENIASHGVNYCTICGKEEIFLVLSGYDFFWGVRDEMEYPNCKCKTESKYDIKYKRISVKECLDCGAVRGPKCPACGKPLWARGVKRFCKNYCGYQI